MKKFFALGLLLFTIFTPLAVLAQPTDSAPVVIEVFERDDCGHCIDFFAFIEDLEKVRDDFVVVNYDVYTEEGKAFFNEATEELRLVKGTPIIYVNEQIIQGFQTAETTGAVIIAEIDKAKEKESVLSLTEYLSLPAEERVVSVSEAVCDDNTACTVETPSYIVTLPFIGKTIDVGKYSLPAMSYILGLIDGFNPCAMWVLVMFVTALALSGSRRRMWEMVGLFLIAEAVMYYLILNVWLYAWDFIGLDHIVTPLIGILAAGAGIYFLHQYFEGEEACKIGGSGTKKSISNRIQKFAQKPLTIVTALGIIGIAFSVNIFEFACSIGIPQTFTKILDINQLNWASKQLYNAIYIFGYMFDDFVVFGIALYGLDKLHITSKYSHLSHLIGGILMALLGLIMLVNPALLVF
ncbi:MAG: glutaredoxin [Candidatus Jacksonbacteria bacterium]|jgi:uncharacterized protein (UPF0333 family)|nr:glutaredoxin [Candidatus Jacksonbacteria bacterium]MBT6034803.1 glutaredoxin [Candidatus Jacksonbacteria bacterium]MBT6301643.1 glutaredoxin [Candidatus Jacksonbacteria bacterium]MBT6757468.1 glutaredoxin [Candidatus Jacksonbacteria bacterium]MBT6955218.1 glutaredoxin [Candidatus Jacksonbacteria bacterium]